MIFTVLWLIAAYYSTQNLYTCMSYQADFQVDQADFQVDQADFQVDQADFQVDCV